MANFEVGDHVFSFSGGSITGMPSDRKFNELGKFIGSSEGSPLGIPSLTDEVWEIWWARSKPVSSSLW